MLNVDVDHFQFSFQLPIVKFREMKVVVVVVVVMKKEEKKMMMMIAQMW